jgi:hypothetical protein
VELMPRGANRTDLLVPKTLQGPGQPNGQPVQVPTGLPYGERAQLQGAQQAVPLPAAAPAPGAGAPAGPPPQTPQGDPIAAARNFQMPTLGPLTGPTQRPNEPVTAGVNPQNGSNGLGAMLSRMATEANSPALGQLAARANALQQ